MKRIFTAVLMLTLCLAVLGFAGTKWQFVKVFPDTTIAFGTGVHGIAVDKAGKIWVGPAGRTNLDSLPNGRATVAIYVYNPDGTEAAFSRIKIINTTGRSDTLTALSRGARADMDGNIVYVMGSRHWKLNYQTGAGMLTYLGLSSGIAPAFTSANEMFTGYVLPGTGPISIWSGSDFSSLGSAVAAAPGYSRTIEVSKDGNDIYWCGYSNGKIFKYHSANGTLGPYDLTDSLAEGCQVESIAWNKKDGYLYFSSGNIDTVDYVPAIKAPWTPTVWYAMDAATKAIKDSIAWNWNAYPYNISPVTNAPRPRGIAFSTGGDTAYVACYNHAKAAIQMFVRVLTSVEPVESGIPSGYTMSQNYPNPFNPSTEIVFALPKAGFTTVKVYDMLGKEVATLVNEELGVGTFKTTLDGSRLSSGTYIYSLTSGSMHISKKMMLVK
jgi:DNA-binding beta-propeller fold protein YncE